MATWQLKDLRRWSEKHPLEGAKISTEQDYPFSWEIPSLKLELNNFEGTFDSMARGDRVVIHNKQGTEIRFAGIIDEIHKNPKDYRVEVVVLNDAIMLKDEAASGAWEKDDDDQYTGNLVVSVNGVNISEALEEATYKQLTSEPPKSDIVQISGEKIFKSDFADGDTFTDTPYSKYGTMLPLFFRNNNTNNFSIVSEGKLLVDYYWPTLGFSLVDNQVKLNYIRMIESSPNYIKKSIYIFNGIYIEKESDEKSDYREADTNGLDTIMNELPNISNYDEKYINQALLILDKEYPLSSDGYTYRALLKISKYNDVYYFIILDVKKRYGRASDYQKEGALRWWIGKIDSALGNITFHYINPKLIDIVRDMAILSNALWWVTQEMNNSLPTLHFYPREAVYTTVDIAPYRAKILNIREDIIYREFDKEISDNVILSDVLKNNIKQYYQGQSGEYIKTKITMFAREIGDTFGIPIMADVKYGNYTIGQAVTFEFVDEDTTIITCMKKNENYKEWYR